MVSLFEKREKKIQEAMSLGSSILFFVEHICQINANPNMIQVLSYHYPSSQVKLISNICKNLSDSKES